MLLLDLAERQLAPVFQDAHFASFQAVDKLAGSIVHIQVSAQAREGLGGKGKQRHRAGGRLVARLGRNQRETGQSSQRQQAKQG